MKVLFIIGTRPEAIKIAPLYRRFKEADFEVAVCNTGQHKDLLTPVLDFFSVNVTYNLGVMVHNQGLHGLTSSILTAIPAVFADFAPDFIFVHGDTTTSMAASLAAFYSGIRVFHVEAGLRTFNKLAPFPEESNRSITARLADLHFAPTQTAMDNLRREGITKGVVVTGNTVIDALFDALKLIDESHPEIVALKKAIDFEKSRVLLFTGHRRENFGSGFTEIFRALLKVVDERQDVQIVYPVHPNPNVKALAEEVLNAHPRVHLIKPLSYGPFIWLMKQSYFILTDSGGVQEEAPSLGKPVLVLRAVTERPEAVTAGTVLLVGTDAEKITTTAAELLDAPTRYRQMSELINPYGDGTASEKILAYVTNYLKQ